VPNSPVDWTELALRVGSLDASGEHSGTHLARAALEEIIGPHVFREAVDHYVSGAPGGELARSVLWHCRPWSAMQRCHELYTATSDLEVRRRSVELLRVVADRRALPWVAEYLANPDMEIQGWGAGIVDQLLWSELVDPEDCEFLLVVIENHPNEAVRERGAFIKEFMGNRETTAV
jgi:hypothetical protein